MELIDLPLTSYLLILFGLLVLTIIVRGFKMPPQHYDNQKTRSLIRKKIILKGGDEENSDTEKSNDQGN